jgi:hypothetical protein
VKQASPTRAQVWRFFGLAALVLAVAAGIALRNDDAPQVALAMVTVLAAGGVAIAVYLTLYPLTHSEQFHSTVLIGGRTRAALERDRALALRAIKELEFDHAMKKVADGDFEEMRRRLRARAVRLIRQLEGTSSYRVSIEQDLEKILASEVPDMGAASSLARRVCGQCRAGNEPDARFCKMCGHPLQSQT